MRESTIAGLATAAAALQSAGDLVAAVVMRGNWSLVFLGLGAVFAVAAMALALVYRAVRA
jgi:hypothetical protein